MHTISIETTLVDAYRFLATKILSIVGVMWLPILLLAGVGAGLVWLTVPQTWFDAPYHLHDEAFLESFVLSPDNWRIVAELIAAGIVFTVFAIVVIATIAVGVMRHALGLKQSTTWIHFSLAAPVWRMIGAFILAELILLALALLASFVLAVVTLVLALIPDVNVSLVAVIVMLVSVSFGLAIAYTAIRLYFFLPATVVSEQQISPMRAWELSHGNFWRIVAVGVLIYLPVAAVLGIVFSAVVLPFVLPAALQISEMPTPEQIEAIVGSLWRVLPAIAVVALLAKIALVGLVTGAMGSAYNQVIAKTPKEPA